jgi:hypothetical protein
MICKICTQRFGPVTVAGLSKLFTLPVHFWQAAAGSRGRAAVRMERVLGAFFLVCI